MRGDGVLGDAFCVSEVYDCCRCVPADAGRLRGVGDESAHHRNNLLVVHALLKKEKRHWMDT